MSHIVDDDPPIKTGVASQAYKDNWDRIFGEPKEKVGDRMYPCERCGRVVGPVPIGCAARHSCDCQDRGL